MTAAAPSPRPARPALAPLAFEPWDGLAGLRESEPFWRAVLALRPLDPLCNAPAWQLAHAEAWAPDETVFGWRVRGPGRDPVAFLAFREEPPRGSLALRRALLLADGTFDSDYLDLPIAPGHARDVLAGLLDRLAARPGIEAVLVSGVPEGSPTWAPLRALLRERRLPSRAGTVPCAAATLPDTFEAYVASLKKRMRSKVRQAARAARERGAALRWCDEPAALEGALDDLFRLHALRWREAGRPGAFADERRRRFYRAFAAAALADGSLRLARLEREGTVLATQLGAVHGERYYQMQEGYDPAHADWRVGTALRALMIERLIAEGVRAYDFMAGTSRHKADWGGAARDCASLAFALPNLRARLAYGARAALDRWRARSEG